MNLKLVNLLLLAMLPACDLTNCGGCGERNGGSPMSGIFVDSPVQGLRFKTATDNGETDEDGWFEIMQLYGVNDEEIIFHIGDLEFPAITSGTIITPADVADNSTGNRSVVLVNILQILQTLDSDRNPANGIYLEPGVHDAFTGTDLDIASVDFDQQVLATLNEITPNLELVSARDARVHFSDSMKLRLQGAWEGEDANDMLVFIDASRYVLLSHNNEAVYGQYTWDAVSNDFVATPVKSTFPDADRWQSSLKLTKDDTFNIMSGEKTTSYWLIRDYFSSPYSDTFSGTWISVNPTDPEDITLLVFEGVEWAELIPYTLIHTKNTQSYEELVAEQLALERGSIRYTDNDLKVDVHYDGDGPAGLYNDYNPNAQIEIEKTGNTQLVIKDAEGNLTVYIKLGLLCYPFYDCH